MIVDNFKFDQLHNFEPSFPNEKIGDLSWKHKFLSRNNNIITILTCTMNTKNGGNFYWFFSSQFKQGGYLS